MESFIGQRYEGHKGNVQGKKELAIHRSRLGITIGILILMGGFHPCPAGSADLKIAFVDIQKVVNECNAGEEAKKTLPKEVEKFQSSIAQKQKELQEMKESIEKQWSMLNPETRAAKEKEFQTKLRDFQRWGEDSQSEINQNKAEMQRNVAVGLLKVIQEVGADEGYTLILEHKMFRYDFD
jgi:outer membrane protein